MLEAAGLCACQTSKHIENEEFSAPEEEIKQQEEEIKQQEETPETEAAPEELSCEEEPDRATKVAQIQEIFGEYCIAEQTFETKLSEYEGNVYVVPFLDPEEGFHIEVIQNGELLTTLYGYVPEHIAAEAFSSLDAISFFDINFDDCTDIVLIQTYGETTFTAIYYGFSKDTAEYERNFYLEEVLSQNVTEQVKDLTISNIREFVTQRKKNGDFTAYTEAYQIQSHISALEDPGDITYDLIYFDEDDIPELVAGAVGTVSLYTFKDGRLYPFMHRWTYGAAGNNGYEYSPEKNSLRNYNHDFAGLIEYTTYMSVDQQHALETVAQIVTYNFDDANKNQMPDEEEMESAGNYSVSYLNSVEITGEEPNAYNVGRYEFLEGKMTYEELQAKLKL